MSGKIVRLSWELDEHGIAHPVHSPVIITDEMVDRVGAAFEAAVLYKYSDLADLDYEGQRVGIRAALCAAFEEAG